MNVVLFANTNFDDGKSFLFTDVLEYLIQASRNFFGKDLPAVFYAPYNVVIDVIYAGSSMYIITHTHSITRKVGNGNMFQDELLLCIVKQITLSSRTSMTENSRV